MNVVNLKANKKAIGKYNKSQSTKIPFSSRYHSCSVYPRYIFKSLYVTYMRNNPSALCFFFESGTCL